MHCPLRGLLAASLLLAQLSHAQTYGDRIEVRVINVDVVVTDRSGAPIHGLSKDDFELFEDGRPVDVTYFSEIADGRLMPVQAGLTEPVPNPVTWVIFVDQTSLRPANRNEALRQLRTFVATVFDDDDHGLIAGTDGMAFRIAQNITGDRKLVLSALERLVKERVNVGPAAAEAATLRRDMANVDPADREALYIARTIGDRISLLIAEETRRTRNAIVALSSTLDVLSRTNRRVAVVYVGSGFNTLPGLALVEAWRSQFSDLAGLHSAPRPEDYKTGLDQEVERLFARLSSARVTLYTIKPGDSSLPSADDPGLIAKSELASFRATGGELGGDRSELNETATAREMAETTGGRVFKISRDLETQLQVIRNDFNHYYSLGYTPAGEPGRTRKIRVKVKTDDVRVRHRLAIREQTEEEQASVAALVRVVVPGNRATPDPPPQNPLGVAIAAERPRRAEAGRGHVLPFRFTMPLETLTFVATGRGQRADLVMHFALVEKNGTVWPLDSREQPLEIPNAELTPPEQQTSYAWHLDLSPLRIRPGIPVGSPGMRLFVSVEDRIAKKRSQIVVPIP